MGFRARMGYDEGRVTEGKIKVQGGKKSLGFREKDRGSSLARKCWEEMKGKTRGEEES